MVMCVWALVETFVMWAGLGSPFFVALVAGVAGGIFVPHVVTSIMIGRRRNAFLKNFPEAIDIMVDTWVAMKPLKDFVTR